MRDYSIIH